MQCRYCVDRARLGHFKLALTMINGQCTDCNSAGYTLRRLGELRHSRLHRRPYRDCCRDRRKGKEQEACRCLALPGAATQPPYGGGSRGRSWPATRCCPPWSSGTRVNRSRTLRVGSSLTPAQTRSLITSAVGVKGHATRCVSRTSSRRRAKSHRSMKPHCFGTD